MAAINATAAIAPCAHEKSRGEVPGFNHNGYD